MCYPHARTGEQAALQVVVHGDFAWITLKALLQSQANESHVFIHQGDLLWGIFYLQFCKEAKPPHF